MPSFKINVHTSGGGWVDHPGSTTVTQGGDFSLSFAAASGYLVHIVTDNGVIVSTVSPFEIQNVQENHTVWVIFIRSISKTHTVTIRSHGPGKCLPTGKQQALDSADFSIATFANPGYELQSIAVDGHEVPKPPIGILTLHDVTGEAKPGKKGRSAAHLFALARLVPSILQCRLCGMIQYGICLQNSSRRTPL